MQKILVVTYTVPDDGTSGDKLYTYHLYRNLAQHASVTVIGYKDLHGGVKKYKNWVQKVITVPRVPRSKLMSTFSIYPNLVFQDRTMVFKQRLRRLVKDTNYDVVICDHFRSFWAADIVNRERKRFGKVRIPTILVTHNHEALVRDKLVKNENNILKKLVFWLDTKKIKWHEKKAFLSFDKITTVTADDAKSISTFAKQKVEVLRPGYYGPIKNQHQITPATSKQVVVLGSYHWVAKQLNLKQLVKAAASNFQKAGLKLVVVGACPVSLIAEISRYKFVEVVGHVESFEKYLENSRMAVIAETTGGGFKLKSLDYVFRKVPMAVIKGTMAGLPLQPNIDYLEYSTVNELVEGVAEEIDNIDKLNLLASNALAACREKFKWEDRGHTLYEIVCKLTEKR